MVTSDQQAMEERHLAKFHEIREVLRKDLVFWEASEHEAYAPRMLSQIHQSIELNASLIKIAEQRIEALQHKSE
ncbi:MAG: hypothetical protein ACRYFS_21950 [Janthinobacterium lividum]